MTTDFLETRPQTILRITRAAWDAKAINLSDFSASVVAAYFSATPASAVNTNFRLPSESDVKQYEKDRFHNRQIVDRLIGGAVKAFPADLEEPWVKSLPDPYRAQVLRELSARYGLLAARIRDSSDAIRSVGDFTADTGAFIQSMSPIMSDGRIDERDLPHLEGALQSLAAVQGDLASLHAQLSAVLNNARERRAKA